MEVQVACEEDGSSTSQLRRGLEAETLEYSFQDQSSEIATQREQLIQMRHQLALKSEENIELSHQNQALYEELAETRRQFELVFMMIFRRSTVLLRMS